MSLVHPVLSCFTRVCTRCQLVNQKHASIFWNYGRVLHSGYSFSTSSNLDNGKSKQKAQDICENPFFDKYKSKIQHLQSTNPAEYEERVQELSDRSKSRHLPENSNKGTSSGLNVQPPRVIPPSDTARAGGGMTGSKRLDSVMKMELIHDKTSQEISEIWNKYHSGSDCVYAVLKAEDYQNLMEKSQECPVFVYPVRRDDGFEFILSQFDRNEVYFTPLGMFQLVRENAPPCLTLTYYTELLENKGIVLMNGQFDEKVLKQPLALSLAQQMSIFYGKDLRFYEIVHRFNYHPEKFHYQELIDILKTLPHCDLQ